MATEINFDVGAEVKNDKIRNFQDRINFIKYWVNFIKAHSDEEWSKGQAVLIDGQFDMAEKFYKDLEKSEEGREILERLKKERLKVKIDKVFI